VSPLRGEKPQNWPLSKLNTGRFALRAMLPVTRKTTVIGHKCLLCTTSSVGAWRLRHHRQENKEECHAVFELQART